MNTTQLNLRIPKEELEVLDDVADGMISRQQAATIVFRRALTALRDNPEKIKLFHFIIDLDAPASLNDSAPTYKTKPTK